jgi:hypothetical protein
MLTKTMRKYQKQDPFFKRKEPRYYRKYRDKLDFALEDMKNFWDDIYNRENRIG